MRYEERLRRLEWLRDAGCPIDEPFLSELKVFQVGKSFISVTHRHGLGLVLDIGFCCQAALTLASLGNVRLPWGSLNALWLQPKDGMPASTPYRMVDGTIFERDAVLNHRIASGLELRPRKPVVGLLLGISSTRIPVGYSHIRRFEGEIEIYDVMGGLHKGAVSFDIHLHEQGRYQRVRSSQLFERETANNLNEAERGQSQNGPTLFDNVGMKTGPSRT